MQKQWGSFCLAIAIRYKIAYNTSGMEKLNKDLLQMIIGLDKQVLVLDSTESTNNDMKVLLQNGAKDGALIVADTQTAGRGRLEGRVFYSPSGSGIYMTCLVKPNCPIKEAGLITPAVAVATAKAIEEVAGIRVGIKWVNDLYYKDKKICGILCESTCNFDKQIVENVIVGIGVNLSKPSSVPIEISNIMGWLLEKDKGIRNELIGKIYLNVNKLLKNMKDLSFMDVYRRDSILINKQVNFVYNNDGYIGTVIDIDDEARLIIKTDKGIIKLNSGEVSLIK